MLLPMSFPYTDAGLAEACAASRTRWASRRIYLKSADYLAPATAARLIEEGRVVAFKYAVVRDDPSRDAYLSSLLQAVDARWIVSGIGERPAIVHYRDFGLKSFTSGSVCIAPRGSMRLLHLLRDGRYEEAEAVRQQYLALEDCRDGISPIRVLRRRRDVSGVADIGPIRRCSTGLVRRRPRTRGAGRARAGRLGQGSRGGLTMRLAADPDAGTDSRNDGTMSAVPPP